MYKIIISSSKTLNFDEVFENETAIPISDPFLAYGNMLSGLGESSDITLEIGKSKFLYTTFLHQFFYIEIFAFLHQFFLHQILNFSFLTKHCCKKNSVKKWCKRRNKNWCKKVGPNLWGLCWIFSRISYGFQIFKPNFSYKFWCTRFI